MKQWLVCVRIISAIVDKRVTVVGAQVIMNVVKEATRTMSRKSKGVIEEFGEASGDRET